MDAILKVYTTAKTCINKGTKAHSSDFFPTIQNCKMSIHNCNGKSQNCEIKSCNYLFYFVGGEGGGG